MPGLEGFPPPQGNNAEESNNHFEQLQLLTEMHESLRFIETPSMKELRKKIVEGDPFNIQTEFKKWAHEVDLFINKAESSEEFQSLMIGSYVYQAAIYLEMEIIDECNECLAGAIEYASHTGKTELVEKLLAIGSK